MHDRTRRSDFRPTSRGRVIGLGLGQFRFVGGGVALLLAATTAFAGPEGARVREGRARFIQRGDRTIIRTSDRAVIDYRSFDIGRGETVRFVQPNSDSRVLNRIQSARPTTIDGTLRSNGRVYIVNPNGVIFTGSSVIDVAHLYAAAGNISNQDFMAGVDRFTGVTGDVTNQGRIEADTAALIGAHVANSGIIIPNSGEGVVAMVSGNEVTLTPQGSSISVKIDASAQNAVGDGRAAIDNSGVINTRGGSTLMAAGDLYALAIRNTGKVRADDIQMRGGSGRVEVSGTLDASDRSVGGRGGNVTITGKDIALNSATIDASGSRSGGAVRIGGDARGGGELPHAQTVSVDSGSSISADALRRGDGGSVVVYADDHTSFGGKASAGGGDKHGDGGFVETSGKNTLDIAGARVNASGKDGNGQWLLDPTDMVIDSAAATAIVASLDTGTDVTIETGSAGADAGNITVDAAIAKTAGGDATLTLRAANDLTVNQAISSTSGELNVNLLANNGAGGNTDPDDTAGSVIFNNDGVTTDGRVAANGGDVTAEGVDFELNGSSTIAGAAVNLSANSSADQSIGIQTGAGAFQVSSAELGAITASDVAVSTTTRNDAASIAAIDLSATGYNLSVRAGSVTADAVQVASGKTLGLRADAGSVTTTGALTASGAGGAINLQGDDLALGSTVTAESVTITANGNRTIGLGGPGDLSIDPAELAGIASTNLAVRSAGSGDITVGNSSDPMMPIAPSAANLTIETAGKIDEVAADDLTDLQVSGRLTLRAGAGIGDPGTDDGTGTGPLDIDAGELDAAVSAAGGLFIKDSGGIDIIDAATTDGAISIRSTGAINITDLTANQSSPMGRTVELVAAGGNITATGTLASQGKVHIEATQPDATITVANGDISDVPGITTTLITSGSMGHATITNAQGLTLADTAVGGNLTVTATTGNIFDDNALIVGGASGFTTAAADAVIDLNTLDAAGPITLSTAGPAGNANIVNAQGVTLAAASIGGSLALTATTGNITNTGAVTVGDVANLTTSTADADITVTQFSSAGLGVHTSGTDGNASIDAVGPVTFGASEVGGSLTVVSTGAIADAGAGPMTVGGAASFTTRANAGADITLDNATNTFGAISARSRDGAGSADAAGDITIFETSIPGNTRMDVTLIGTTGSVTLVAPDIAIDTGSMGAAISAGASDITLRPSTAGATIGLDAAADFSLDLAELRELSTTGRVVIGAADSGAITVGGISDLDLGAQTYDLGLRGGATSFAHALTLGSDRLLSLQVGAISSTGGSTDVTIGGTNGRVVIDSTGAVDLDISAARLAVNADAGDITIDNAATGLEIGSIDSIDGVTAAMDGDITITTAGALSIASPVATSGTGVVTLNAADGIADATASGDAVTAATVVLGTTAGSITASGGAGEFKTNTQSLTATAPGGINIANSGTATLRATLSADMGAAVLSSGGSISTNGVAWAADSFVVTAGGAAPDGVVTINDSISADNGGISITANDLQIGGVGTALNAGAGVVTIARATDGTIGVGNIASEDMNISNEELAAITAAELIVGDSDHTSRITARDVDADDSQNIGTVTLRALADNAGVAFSGTASTFNALTVRSDAGIDVDSNIIADTGALDLDADADMAADADAPGVMGAHQDQIFIRSGRMLTTQPGGGNVVLRGAAGGSGMTAGILSDGDLAIDSNQDVVINSSISVDGTLTLDAGGTVTFAGAGEGMVLNIAANNGINFGESVTNQGGNLSIDADADDDGMGAFTLATDKTLTTSNGNLDITAADIVLDGSIAAGTGQVTITRSTPGDIAVGAFTDMAGRLTITGDELGRISAGALTIGGGPTAAIAVDGVTDMQSMGIAGLTTLDAGTTLTFSGGASTFNSLRGDADQDITVSGGLNTDGPLTLNADVDSNDSGLLNISAPIATGNGEFIGTGTDLVLTAAINAGTGDITFSRSAAGSITVDNAPDAAGRMVIDDSELALLTGGRLTIGGGVTDIVTVRNFSATDGAGIAGITTFDANDQLTFNGSSTFKELLGKSDNLVLVNGNLTTTAGDITLNGNGNAADDTDDRIEIGSGRTIDSAGNLTLSASRGGIEGLGSLTLRAAGEVRINHNLTTSGDTVIAADTDGNGSGGFILPASTVLNTSGSNLGLTAADIELNGNIITGGGAAGIDRSAAGNIALGAVTDQGGTMTITGAELARIVATGLTIGGANTTNMTVNGVTDSNSNSIAGTLTLSALGNDGEVRFEGTASRFNALSVKADSRVVTEVSLVTDSGSMTLDGGANTADKNDGLIALGAGLIASSTGTATAANFFDLTFNSPVRLRANPTIEAEDITFNSRLNSAAGEFRLLTINSHESGTTVFRGTVGGDDRLAGLFTNADGVTRLGADVFTTREGVTFDDRMVLTDDVKINDSGSGVAFGGTIDSDDDGTPRSLTVLSRRNTSDTVNSLPTITFTEDVGATHRLKNIYLNCDPSTGANGRDEIPRVATIVARPVDNNGNFTPVTGPLRTFQFLATDEFRMGQNEKLTVGGHVRIRGGDRVTLGDVAALGDFTVNSPDIRLLRRAPGTLSARDPSRLTGTGVRVNDVDNGVDYVAGGIFRFTSTPVAVGEGANPQFGNSSGVRDAAGALNAFIFQTFSDFNRALIDVGNPIITQDLKSSGPSDTNFATALAGAIPRESRENDVSQIETINAASFSELEQLGVFPRDLSDEERVAGLIGWSTYDDYPETGAPTEADFRTAVNRLPGPEATGVLARHQKIFYKSNVDPQTGEARAESLAPEIKKTFEESIKRFRAQAGTAAATERVDPVALREYIERAPEESASLAHARQLQGLLRDIELLGLTSRELRKCKSAVLRLVRPNGLGTREQFETFLKTDIRALEEQSVKIDSSEKAG